MKKLGAGRDAQPVVALMWVESGARWLLGAGWGGAPRALKILVQFFSQVMGKFGQQRFHGCIDSLLL